MNRRKIKVTYRRYLGPALYDLIHAEQSHTPLPITTGQLAKLARDEAE